MRKVMKIYRICKMKLKVWLTVLSSKSRIFICRWAARPKTSFTEQPQWIFKVSKNKSCCSWCPARLRPRQNRRATGLYRETWPSAPETSQRSEEVNPTAVCSWSYPLFWLLLSNFKKLNIYYYAVESCEIHIKMEGKSP